MAEPEHISLNAGQLRALAFAINNLETDAILSIDFKGDEYERSKYLNASLECYQDVLDILDAVEGLVRSSRNDRTKGRIACDINSYILNALNFSLQFLNNYLLRANHLGEIKAHVKNLENEVDELDETDLTKAKALSKKVVGLNKAMLRYVEAYRSIASANFSRNLAERGVTFAELVITYQNELGFEGAFEGLTDIQKIEVYDEIMAASGRGRVFTKLLKDVLKGAEIPLILFTAALMVVDIFSSSHVLEKATRVAVETAASVGGAILLDKIVSVAVATITVDLASGPFIVVTAGLVAGIVGAFILGEFAGALMNSIFGSGGAPLSTDGYRCYVAPLPDGYKLATELAYKK